MSQFVSPDYLASLRQEIQQLVEQTSAHQAAVKTLVRSVERELLAMRAAASPATDADVSVTERTLHEHTDRTAANAATTRELARAACAQHLAACRLLAGLDDERAARSSDRVAVLVVDDYEAVRELIAGILERAGFAVRTAVNGLDGLLTAYEMRPGVIVMDVTMPVLDGIAATRLIKASDATRGARVIAYTSHPSFEDPAAQALFSAVLQKPATPAIVVATVQQVAGL